METGGARRIRILSGFFSSRSFPIEIGFREKKNPPFLSLWSVTGRRWKNVFDCPPAIKRNFQIWRPVAACSLKVVRTKISGIEKLGMGEQTRGGGEGEEWLDVAGATKLYTRLQFCCRILLAFLGGRRQKWEGGNRVFEEKSASYTIVLPVVARLPIIHRK